MRCSLNSSYKSLSLSFGWSLGILIIYRFYLVQLQGFFVSGMINTEIHLDHLVGQLTRFAFDLLSEKLSPYTLCQVLTETTSKCFEYNIKITKFNVNGWSPHVLVTLSVQIAITFSLFSLFYVYNIPFMFL